MAQEEHTQKCSKSGGGDDGGGESGSASGDGGGGGGGGRSSKKLKQKKVPQRGLGVAQLEKIRLEEQHRKEIAVQAAAVLSPNSIISTNSSCLGVQCPNYRHTLPPSSIPLPPPPSLTNLSSSNSLFRPPPPNPNPNADSLHPNCAPFSPLLNGGGGGGEIGRLPVSGSGNITWPKLCNCEYNPEGENNRLDNHGFSIHSNLNLPYECWSPPHVMHRAQHQQSSSSSSMVNVSSGTSSSSVINFQMEPPSNQNYYSNSYAPMWPDEDKIIGIKRPYPFALDNPAAGTSSQCKFPPTYVAPTNRSDDSASCGNGGAINIEAGNPIFREGPSSSASRYEPNLKKVTKETGGLSGNFLTLAPPMASLPRLSSKYKTHSANVASPSHELSETEPLPYRGRSMEEPVQEQGARGFIQQKPFYSFLPLAKAHDGQTASSTRNSHGEVEGGVDLNLKL